MLQGRPWRKAAGAGALLPGRWEKILSQIFSDDWAVFCVCFAKWICRRPECFISASPAYPISLSLATLIFIVTLIRSLGAARRREMNLTEWP